MKGLVCAVASCLLFFIPSASADDEKHGTEAPAVTREMCSVKDFGARGDGVANDTAAIQRALDTGKIVFLPDGVYLCGTLHLRSNGGLKLSPGATIRASRNLADYNRTDYCPQNWDCPEENVSGRHLISAVEVENVVIEGGTIDGDALYWTKGKRPNRPLYFPHPERPAQMLFFCESRKIVLRNTTLRNASYWHCFFHGCETVLVEGVTVRSDPMIINGDGLDIDCCADVVVRNCDIVSADDALTLRADTDRLKNPRPCENIVVENCRLDSAYATGIRLGVGSGEIRNCTFRRLRITHAKNGFNLVAKWSDTPDEQGVSIRNVLFSEIELYAMRPFLLNLDHRYVPMKHSSRAVFDGITFEKIRGRGELTSYLQGNRSGVMRNIVFRDVDLVYGGAGAAPLIDGNGLWCVDSEDVIFSLQSVGEVRFEKVRLAPNSCWKSELRLQDSPHVFHDDKSWRVETAKKGD